MRLGITLNETNSPREAISYFNRVLKKDPKNTDVIINKGISYHILGRYVKALGYFDKALKYDSHDANALYYKARSLAMQKKDKDVLNVLKLAFHEYEKHEHGYDDKEEIFKERARNDEAFLRLFNNTEFQKLVK
jgi:tetratricopeptide (TPR) repeat protein